MHHETVKTNSNLKADCPRAHSIKSQLWFFPDVLAKLILTYDYNLDGTVDWELRSSYPKRIEVASDFSDGRVTTVLGNSVTVWDCAGNSLWTLRLGNYICMLKVLPCDIILVQHRWIGGPGEVSLFDSNTYSRLVAFTVESIAVLQPDQADEEDGTVRMVSFATKSQTLELFSYRRGCSSPPKEFCEVEEPVNSVEVLPNNKFVVITTGARFIRWIYVFQCVANEMCQLSRQGFTNDVRSLKFRLPTLDDGVVIAGLAASLQNALLLFKDLKTGKEIVLLRCSDLSRGRLLGQSRLLCCSENEILIFDLATQQKQMTLRKWDLRRNRFVVLPNEDLAVSDTCVCQATDIEVYNTETGVKERTIHVASPQFVEGINHVSVATCKWPSTPIANMDVLPSGRLAWLGAVLQIYR